MMPAKILPLPRRLATRDGASAEILDHDGREVVAVKDRRGRVIFEYDAETGRGAITMPEGDLALHAPRGGIDLVSATGIRCVSGGEVLLHSQKSASIQVGDAVLKADARGVAIRGRHLALDADRANLAMREARYTGEQLDADVSLARITMNKLETAAERVISSATHLFQEVRDLHQLKAGRVRTLVRDTFSLKGRDVTVKATEDVHLDGERINLG